MRVQTELRRRLEERFDPSSLEIVDDSHRHAGHMGARAEGETHFTVTLVSAAFAGQSRVARQRSVFEAVGDLLQTDIHALALTTKTPDEAEA